MRQIRFVITRIRESVQHIRRNSFSMATSILYLLCLFIFLIDETRLEIMPAYAHWNTMLCIGEVVVFLLAATWKIPGSWLVILTSWIGLVTPFHVSAALIFGCMLAITLLGFNRLSYGISAVLLYFALHISVTYARHMPINRSDALLLLMTLMLCCFAGSILHRSQINADRLRQLMQLKHRQKAAIELHDRTCNNLTYAIRLIDERAHTQPSKTDMQEIRTVLQKSLSQTRKVISYLAADDSAETVPLTNNTHQLRQLDSIISEARHRLGQLSFQGEIINSITDCNACPKKTASCYSIFSTNCSPTSSNMPIQNKAISLHSATPERISSFPYATLRSTPVPNLRNLPLSGYCVIRKFCKRTAGQ